MAAVTNEKKNLNSQTEDVSEFIMLLKQISTTTEGREETRSGRTDQPSLCRLTS